MPIDKRKMTNITNQHRWLLSMNFSTNTIYFLFIFISLAWNAYNTYQHQILTERQSKLEQILTEIFPSFHKIPVTTSSSTEQWLTKARHFIQELTSISNSHNDHIVKPNKVRFVFLEMLIESLDTCI
jgi:hypothetical protein